ncbi:hypothetical protein PS15m_009386 [Mucor circinelloides]
MNCGAGTVSSFETKVQAWCLIFVRVSIFYFRSQHLEELTIVNTGKIRFMEDTEICLYDKKSVEDSQNQLWAVQAEFQPTEHPLVRRRSSQKTPIGSVIYSVAKSDWVLDVCTEGQKLILFPYNQDLSHQQRWLFIPEKEMILTEEPTSLFGNNKVDTSSAAYYSTPISSSSFSSSNSSSYSIDSTEFAYGLTPAKRCSSQSSLQTSSRKSS